MDPAEVLDRIPGFAGAVVLQVLSDGPTNSSHLLERGREKFVLRLDKPAACNLGLDRENEGRVLDVLAKGRLTPEPVYHDVSGGILLRPWQPGRTWTPRDLDDRDNLHRLARLLRRLHAVEPVGKVFDPLGAARRYAGRLGDGESAAVLQRAEQLADDLAMWPESLALCHNDPVCHNIIDGESLSLIDWEYAAAGDRYFDLAVVLQHHGLDDSLSGFFLERYLDRLPRNDELQHLRQQRNFYACLLTLWNQVTG